MSEQSQTPVQAFELGEFLVEPSLNRITGSGQPAQVEPRIMAVLVALAHRPGAVVTRRELLETVWHDSVVSDETLTRAIFHLRRHLGDDTGEPRFIETIRKRGYRLLVPVVPVARDETGISARTTDVPRRRIAGRGRRRRYVGVAGVVAAAGLGLTYVAVPYLRGPGGEPEPPVVASLTSYPGHERHPSISPDGSLVAFTMTDVEDGTVDLYVKHTGSESLLRLTDDQAVESWSSWSPDGGRIAFAKHGDRGAGIYVVPAIGGQATRVLTSPSEISGVSWAPNGASLAYSAHATDESPRAIHLLDLARGTSRTLTTPPAWNVDWQPEVSPDGEHVAFVRADPAGNEDLWLVSMSGGEARRLTQGAVRVRGLAWDPDGRHLVYSTLAHGPFRLWQIDTRSEQRTWLAIPGDDALDPAIARLAGFLVYVESRLEASIWRARLAERDALGQQYESLLRSTQWETEARYSPDGARLAFTSSRAGSLEIWLADADGRHARQLTHFAGPLAGTPRWSPDGARIAFAASPDGKSDVYVVDVAGGAPRRLTREPSNEIPSGWSRDGQWIYLASDRTPQWQIWRIRADGSMLQRITARGGREARESTDGAWLYVTRPDEPGLWQLPAGHAEEGVPNVTEPLPSAHMAAVFDDLPVGPGYDNWVIRGDRLFALVGDTDGARVVAVNLTTHRRQDLPALQGIASATFDVSPDGSNAVYPRIDRSESDLRLLREFRWRTEGQ